MPEEYQYTPLQLAPAPAPPEKIRKQLFLEPIQPVAPIQVHFDSPEPSVPPKPNTIQERLLTRTKMSDIKAKSRPSRVPIKSSGAQSTPSAPPRVRFDQYDCHPLFPSRQDLKKRVALLIWSNKLQLHSQWTQK